MIDCYDDDALRMFHAPTTQFPDEQRECFEYYTERRGKYGMASATFRPGCDQTLIDSVRRITVNFP